MSAPQKILLVMDDTPGVLEEAMRLTKLYNAHLTGLFVMDATWNGYVAHDWLSGSGSRADFLDYIKDEEEKAAREALHLFESATHGMEAEFVLAAGHVVEQTILQMGKGYDLTIVPNPMHRGLEMMRDGAADLCRKASGKVLLVPPKKA